MRCAIAKYGSFVYGSAQYGTGDAGPQPVYVGDYVYILNVRWGGTWANEANRCVMAEYNDGRQFYVGRGGTTFEYMQPGTATFTLDNFDQRYDPYYAAGPLYGLIEPGLAVEFSMLHVPTGANVHQFTGHIADIRPTSGRYQVQVIVHGNLQWLADQNISLAKAENIKVSDAIKNVLTTAGYPYAKGISASNCPITYFSPQEANALDTLRSLSDAGLGTIFTDRHGVLKYYDFSTTGQPTHTIDQAIIKKEITVMQPWDTVRNDITCIANRYGYGKVEPIWRMDETITIPASGSKVIPIKFAEAKVYQPVLGVDYFTRSTFENFVPGVGYTNTFYYLTVWLTDITPTSANINIHNNYSGGTSHLDTIVVRGNFLINKKVPSHAEDAASKKKGPKSLVIDSPYLQDPNFADAYVGKLLTHLKTPSKDPVITFQTRPEALGIDLLDRLTLTSTKLGINNTYDVGGRSYRWLNNNGQSWEMTYYLQTILYSTMAITPAPFTPPGEENTPPEPPVLVSGLEACLSLTGTNLATGPWAWSGGIIGTDSPHYFSLRKWIRSASHPKRTYIEVDASWEAQSSGVWTLDDSFDFDTLQMLNSAGTVVATGTLVSDQVSNGIRTYQFDNLTEEYAQALKLSIPGVNIITPDVPADIMDRVWRGTMTNLIPGTEVLKSGTFSATYATTNQWRVDKINVDDLYGEGVMCLTTSGDYALLYNYLGDIADFHYTGGTVYRRDNNVQKARGAGRKTYGLNGAPFSDSGFIPSTGDGTQIIIQTDNIDGYHSRIYFEVVPDPWYQGTIPYNHWWISAYPPYYSAGEVTQYGQSVTSQSSYVITRAQAVIGGSNRVTVRSIKIYNVCEE